MKSFGLGSYALSASVAVALLAGCGGSQLPIGNGGVPSALVPAASKTETFHYTGKKQTFIVPPGVTRIRVKAMGAGTMSARGGLAAATIAVQPGESLAIFVGGAPRICRAVITAVAPVALDPSVTTRRVRWWEKAAPEHGRARRRQLSKRSRARRGRRGRNRRKRSTSRWCRWRWRRSYRDTRACRERLFHRQLQRHCRRRRRWWRRQTD